MIAEVVINNNAKFNEDKSILFHDALLSITFIASFFLHIFFTS